MLTDQPKNDFKIRFYSYGRVFLSIPSEKFLPVIFLFRKSYTICIVKLDLE